MKQLLYAAAVAGALCAFATASQAGIVASQGTLAASTIDDFSDLPVAFAPTTHSGVGVTEIYIGTTSGGINSNFLSNTDLSWRPLLGQGHTEALFLVPIEAFGISVGDANNANTALPFSFNGQVYNGATLLTTFSFSGLSYAQLTDYMFVTTGTDVITKIDFNVTPTVLGGYNPNGSDRGVFDHFKASVNTRIDTGAIPEPATWGMMLLGFGGIGVLLRNRRRKAAFA